MLVALVVGCGDQSSMHDGGAPGPSASTVTSTVFQASRIYQLDVLFVVDDTSAFAPQAPTLASSIVTMAAALRAGRSRDESPSLHVGFVGASAGADAVSSRGGPCGLPSPTQYLNYEACGQLTNFAGTLESMFSCLSDLGDSASAPSQPFAALQRTLSGDALGWAGFLRPTADLAIVVIAAEDDASGMAGVVDSVSNTVDFLRGLKTNSDQVTVSVIGPSIHCPSNDVEGTFPPRLNAFVDALQGVYYPIWGTDYTRALHNVLASFGKGTSPTCIEGVRDVDPATPGLQADCRVTSSVSQADGSSTTVSLPSCDEGAPPCWSLMSSFFTCVHTLAIYVNHGPDYCAASAISTRFECVGCLDPTDPACTAP